MKILEAFRIKSHSSLSWSSLFDYPPKSLSCGDWSVFPFSPCPSLRQLLNCIMDMVEKTRRSLTVLRRCQEADREELNYWIRRYSDAEDLKKGGSSSSSHSRQQSPVNPDPVALGIFSSDGHTEQIYLMLLILPLFLICLGKNKGATENCRTINTLYPQIRLVC